MTALSIGDVLRLVVADDFVDQCISQEWDIFCGGSEGKRPGVCSQAMQELGIHPSLDPGDPNYTQSLDDMRDEIIEGADASLALIKSVEEITRDLSHIRVFKERITLRIERLRPRIVESISSYVARINKKRRQRVVQNNRRSQ